MLVVEQTALIKAPMAEVMAAMNDVESIPNWATVEGTVENVQGSGPGMTYDWRFTVDTLTFKGQSEVIEQTATTLITRTTGDIDSIWTITLAPAGIKSTAMRVEVEYISPNPFVEVMADIVVQRYAKPEVAEENMKRFKEMVEARAKIAAKRV